MFELFEPLTIYSYILKHKDQINPSVNWVRIAKLYPLVTLKMFTPGKGGIIYHPWWHDGGWTHGNRQKVYKTSWGKTDALIRIPCIQFKGRLIALDGNHRLLIVRPKVIVTDIIHCRKEEEARCFVDLFAKGYLT